MFSLIIAINKTNKKEYKCNVINVLYIDYKHSIVMWRDLVAGTSANIHKGLHLAN